jgi:hypothetical protein
MDDSFEMLGTQASSLLVLRSSTSTQDACVPKNNPSMHSLCFGETAGSSRRRIQLQPKRWKLNPPQERSARLKFFSKKPF